MNYIMSSSFFLQRKYSLWFVNKNAFVNFIFVLVSIFVDCREIKPIKYLSHWMCLLSKNIMFKHAFSKWVQNCALDNDVFVCVCVCVCVCWWVIVNEFYNYFSSFEWNQWKSLSWTHSIYIECVIQVIIKSLLDIGVRNIFGGNF